MPQYNTYDRGCGLGHQLKQLLLVHLSLYTKAETLLKGL